MIAKTWALALFESPTSPLPLHSARPRVDEGKHAVWALGGHAVVHWAAADEGPTG